jgi:hypothetical protein
MSMITMNLMGMPNIGEAVNYVDSTFSSVEEITKRLILNIFSPISAIQFLDIKNPLLSEEWEEFGPLMKYRYMML